AITAFITVYTLKLWAPKTDGAPDGKRELPTDVARQSSIASGPTSGRLTRNPLSFDNGNEVRSNSQMTQQHNQKRRRSVTSAIGTSRSDSRKAPLVKTPLESLEDKRVKSESTPVFWSTLPK